MKVSRRELLRTGGAGAAAVVGGGLLGRMVQASETPPRRVAQAHGAHGPMGTVGVVDHARNGFDPSQILYDFDTGEVSTHRGRRVREYTIVAQDKEIEIAPGLFFPAWTYNGRVPGPTLRATEGERLRVEFRNGGSHPHTIHFHGIHSARMDGVPGVGLGDVLPGDTVVYEFDAFPFGCHLYHCHSVPLKRHIHKGLYGAFIIDPDPARHGEAARPRTLEGAREASIREMVMVMNAFDTNFDGENEVYAVNTVAFAYVADPIRIRAGELQRAHVINITEFDPINSIHLHANFFHLYRTGTSLTPDEFTDTISMGQAERHMIEFTYREPGRFMFHAHQTEFVDLGWMSFFEVV